MYLNWCLSFRSILGWDRSRLLPCVFIVYTVCVIYVSFVSLLVSVKAHSLLSLSSAVLLSFACSFYLSRTRSKTRTLSKALVLVHRTRCNCSPFCWTQKALFNIYYVAQRTIYHKEVAMDLLNSFFFFLTLLQQSGPSAFPHYSEW